MTRALALGSLVLSCCGAPGDPREATVVQVLVKADEVVLRARPQLEAGKFERMGQSPFSYYRGNLALFRADWEAGLSSQSGFLAGTPPVLGLGDPHPENFGLLAARDGTLALEPNDFDSADRVPYLFDLRRLVGGLGVGAQQQNPSADVERIAEATARAYALALTALADGQAPQRLTDAQGSAVLQDLFKRGARNLATRAELDTFTEVVDGRRRLLRGFLDPTDPASQAADVPAPLSRDVPQALTRLGEVQVLDVVRELGSGVSSWPRVRLLVLLQGPTDALDDDQLLELKELTESSLAGWYRPTEVASDTPSRVEAALRRAWAVPDADPNWFTTTWWGLPVQVRSEQESNKGVRVARWQGARGTDDELVKLGQVLGALLARVHARSEPDVVQTVAAQVGRDVDAFAAEQASFAAAHAAQVRADFDRFNHARATLGPLLGVQVTAEQTPPSLAAAVFGAPLPPPP